MENNETAFTNYCAYCGQSYVSGTLHFCPKPTPQAVDVIEAMNDKIACTPFPTTSVEKMNSGKGFATAKQTVALTALIVVYGNDKVPAGSTVFVRGDLCLDAEAKRTYEMEGTQIIFIPMSEIKIVKKQIFRLPQYYPYQNWKIEAGGNLP